MSSTILISGGRVVDPSCSKDGMEDLFIENGVFRQVPPELPESCRVLDASGCVVVPGLIDMHVHFREPGDEESETMESGARAAAAGGFVQVLTMPNTSPPVDSPAMVRGQIRRAAVPIDVRCAACMTRERRGEIVADLESLAAAGATAFTDDGSNVRRADVLAEAMRRAARLGRTVLDHALDPALAGNGVMRAGRASVAAGLPGIPARAEVEAIERDIRAAEASGCRLHIQHISTGEGVALVAAARARGLAVSAEATPHHLSFADEDVNPADANFKMSPPLGTALDRKALRRALADGVIEALATDHAPHIRARKDLGFARAPFGVVGLETAVGATYTDLVIGGHMDLMKWAAAWTTGPARILGLPEPSLDAGKPGRTTVLDLRREWTVDPSRFQSRSRNTPFAGRRLTGAVRWTVCDGRVVWEGC